MKSKVCRSIASQHHLSLHSHPWVFYLPSLGGWSLRREGKGHEIQNRAIQCNVYNAMLGCEEHLSAWVSCSSYKTLWGWFTKRNRLKTSAKNRPYHPPPPHHYQRQINKADSDCEMEKNVLLKMRSKLQACPVFGMLFWCLVVDSVSGVVHNWVHSSVSLSAVIRSVSEGPELLQAAHQFHSISAVRQTRRGPRGKDSKDKVGLCQWHGVIVMS